MQYTFTSLPREYHLLLSADEWHTLRGYLRRARANGVTPSPTLAKMLIDMNIPEMSA